MNKEKKYINKYRDKYESFENTPDDYKYVWNSEFDLDRDTFLNKYWITDKSIIKIPDNSTHTSYVRSVGINWIKVISNYRGELYFIGNEYNLKSNRKIKDFLNKRNEYSYHTVVIYSTIDNSIYQYSPITREGYSKVKNKIEKRCIEYGDI